MKLTQDSINNINLFENITGAKVKDCIQDEGKLIFLINEGSVKKALGYNNNNIKKISKILKKEIKIIAFSEDINKFISNLIYPNKADEIKIENKKIIIKVRDNVVKGKIYGRGRENLRKITSIVKNYFQIEEIIIE